MVMYVAAALLCHYAGKDVTEANIKAICSAAGADFVAEDVAPFLAKVQEMGIEAAMAEGASKMSAAPAMGSGSAPAAAAAGGAAAAAPAEQKKEESEEEEDDIGLSLFD